MLKKLFTAKNHKQDHKLNKQVQQIYRTARTKKTLMNRVHRTHKDKINTENKVEHRKTK